MATDAELDQPASTGTDLDGPGVPDGVAATETYRTDEGTVFYDTDNPIAWIQSADPVQLGEVQ